MSIILTLDDFDPNKTEQHIRLKKTYDITLCNIFPPVLENIIHDYVHDIIEAKLTHVQGHRIKISIIDQYINCACISFTYIHHINTLITCCVEEFNFSSNIVNITHIDARCYPLTFLFNEYMRRHYNKRLYIDNEQLRDVFYDPCYKLLTTYGNDVLNCTYNNSLCVLMHIHNHKLFKNIIIMIKCLMKKIDKYNH